MVEAHYTSACGAKSFSSGGKSNVVNNIKENGEMKKD